MGQNEFLKKRDERDRKYFEAGMQTGIQTVTDYIQLALREPEAVGRDLFGRGRIEKLFAVCSKMDDHFHVAFSGGVEADYVQEELDAALREIYGDDLVPFGERYPWVKKFGYLKPQKGWVK